MKTKLLKKGLFLIIATLLMAVPVFDLSANTFDGQSVIDLINKDRAERNISPLTANEKLSNAAKLKADDMFLHNYFAHVSPDGVTPWQWIAKSGYDYSFAGENLATNFTNPELQHQALMNSESHKKNILNENYKEIGVAVVAGMINGKQTIVTVQEFGTESKIVPANKTVAGLAVSKATVAENNIGKAVLENKQTSINAVQKLPSVISKKLSLIPFFSFLYASIVMIAVVFFMYEVMHGRIHLKFHFFSLRKKQKVNTVEVVEPESLSSPVNLNDNINFGKVYINHMKMRN